MLKFLLHHLFFLGTMFAAGAPAIGGGDGYNTGGIAAPASGAPGAASGTQPAHSGAAPDSGTAPGSQPGGAPAQGNDGLRQLRETYENLKKEFEPWQKLGVKPDQVTQFQGVYQKLHSEAASIGRELGYPDEEIAEALAEDPVRTLDFLRNQAAQAAETRQQPGEQDLNELVQQHIEKAIGPIQQRENIRLTDEANALFERTVRHLAVDAFKAEGITDVAQIPKDEMFMLTSAVSEILKYDESALQALKYEGKTAAIQKAFTDAKNYLDKYFLARSSREQARVQPNRGAGRPAQANEPVAKPSLDDIIYGTDVATRAMASLRSR